MNGRAVFAVSRSSNPVLAWEQPYPDMPAAAAAAISPADPFGRCWQNQVDAGTSFPYFGALYNNSPTAYRLQAGCMPNLGQFWPPTPPPDGCGRFDGSNLYFGPPVLRHTENLSSNIRSSFQGLGHYPHLVETPKEQSQRMFKRETPVSPSVSVSNVAYSSACSKSDNFNSCCVDSKLKSQNSVVYSIPKHDLLTVSSGHESYLSAPDSRSNCSSLHPSTDKSCMSPSLKNGSLNFHSSPQDNAHHRAKPLNQENASPLKNVYFSHFESENISSCSDKPGYEHRNNMSKSSKHHQPPMSGYHHHPHLNFPKDRQPEYNRGDGVVLIKEQLKQKTSSSSSFKVKHEKKDHTDCKFQKSSSSKEYRNSDMFSIPTSAMHPKIEPSDKFYLPSCSSAGYRYPSASPYKDDLRVGGYFHGSLAKPWQFNELPPIGLEGYFRSPEAVASLHEGQTAPPEVKSSLASTVHSRPLAVPKRRPVEVDDEVQIIGVQTNKHSSSKHESRNSHEKAKDKAPVLTAEPMRLKSEKDEPPKLKVCEPVSGAEPLSCPSLEKITPVENSKSPSQSKPSSEKTSKFGPNTSSVSNSLKNVTVKKELTAEIETAESKLPSADPLTSSANVMSPKTTELKVNCDNKVLESSVDIKPEKVSLPTKGSDSHFCVNHGLNLIVKSIEQRMEKSESDQLTMPDITSDVNHPGASLDKTVESAEQPRGLVLLSVIAGQRLMSDFNQMKREPDQCVDMSEESLLKSNYPDMNGKPVLESQVKPKCEVASDSFKSSVFEMQNRLAELRKKYKQKQRELMRLKPKKRFANTYLKGRQKAAQENCETSISSGTCDSLNTSFCSSISTDQDMPNSKSSNELSQSDSKNENSDVSTRKKIKRHLRTSVKKEPTDSSCDQLDKRITRRSAGKSNMNFELSEKSRNIKKSLRNKASRLRRSLELSLNQMNEVSQGSKSRRESSKPHNSLPENTHVSKVYSLRHSSQSSSRRHESKGEDSASACKTLSSKRKSDNPKKYMPSKQSKLSETIIAKQLRNRILFDTSCATSDEENFKDGVPDDLYHAMMECHLEEPKNGSKLLNNTPNAADSKPLCFPEPSKLKDEHLIENQRLLALEDGLFYAGYVKEYHSSKKYGIALDGQRGNRLHMFTREEMLTQTIVESKPLTSELPEGTRVCAYWSQQYRCLYPGVVGKAPCPSADWSEPRVFVLFDDGDSGQIPTKNIRLIPPDIISAETAWKSSTETVSSRMESRGNSRNRSRKFKCSTPANSSPKNNDPVQETESKESSCGSPNESSCDDSCFNDLSLSPSHPTTPSENGLCPFSPKTKRKRSSKRRTSSRHGQHDDDDGKEAKAKRHKRYKDKHRRRHHHHHRHHHRHHRHHHSKKHKHRRKSAPREDPGHSETLNLPQDGQVC